MAIAIGNVLASATTVYTSSGNSAITWCSITNYSTTDNASVSVHVVPKGGNAGDTNVVISNLVITANDTYQLYVGSEKILLSDGDFISVTADAAGKITTVISYTSI